ncbi:60S ribosomal protein L18a-1-like isoform X3 [Hibiscus syriacus]|uniref:60S ribosomal protein L18a-1-like isoform X3 n=1 Tax=Hibiscus syriacus TaxID=106335 RepID=A0A6A3BCL8_HIBSY|nr:60S ribosomal protein L18a-1-like isoform X3 [Hibiscus syriacus]
MIGVELLESDRDHNEIFQVCLIGSICTVVSVVASYCLTLHCLLALVYYGSLRNVVPFFDQRAVARSTDAVRPDWLHALYIRKLREKLGETETPIMIRPLLWFLSSNQAEIAAAAADPALYAEKELNSPSTVASAHMDQRMNLMWFHYVLGATISSSFRLLRPDAAGKGKYTLIKEDNDFQADFQASFSTNLSLALVVVSMVLASPLCSQRHVPPSSFSISHVEIVSYSFLIGLLCPLMWYYATFLYFGNNYRKDPRERAGLAASAIAVSIPTLRPSLLPPVNDFHTNKTISPPLSGPVLLQAMACSVKQSQIIRSAEHHCKDDKI